MSETIHPEAAQPTSTQGFEQSDRNPVVTEWSGIDNGGQMSAPAAAESRVTPIAVAPGRGVGTEETES